MELAKNEKDTVENIKNIKNLMNNPCADVNATETKSTIRLTAIMFAVRRKNFETVKFLQEKKADVNARDAHGKTVLMWAIVPNNTQIIKLLIEKSANVSATCLGRVSVQGVKSLGCHFACLCQLCCYHFTKRKWKYFYTFNHFYSKKSSKRAK